MNLISGTRSVLLGFIRVLALVLIFPAAAITGFGRFSRAFQSFAQLLAIVPGPPGDFIRVAYYYLTLRKCSLYSKVSFGSFFAQSSSSVGRGVYVGAYCVLGACSIGDRTQIASHVQLLSGGHQHQRDIKGRILGATEENFVPVLIGEDCWIGAAAVVMADLGARTTVGAAALVNRPTPEGVTVVGNPARLLGTRT